MGCLTEESTHLRIPPVSQHTITISHTSIASPIKRNSHNPAHSIPQNTHESPQVPPRLATAAPPPIATCRVVSVPKNGYFYLYGDIGSTLRSYRKVVKCTDMISMRGVGLRSTCPCVDNLTDLCDTGDQRRDQILKQFRCLCYRSISAETPPRRPR